MYYKIPYNHDNTSVTSYLINLEFSNERPFLNEISQFNPVDLCFTFIIGVLLLFRTNFIPQFSYLVCKQS